MTVRQLSRQSGYSSGKIRGIIAHFLGNPPCVPERVPERNIYAIIDGTYLEQGVGMVVAMEGGIYTLAHGRYGIIENPTGMQILCTELTERGYALTAATTDGNRAVIRAIVAQWPGIVVQRCLVHVQRQGLMWCRRFPTTPAGKHLRRLFLRVTRIDTYAERDKLIGDIGAWERHYGLALAARSPRGWVMSDLMRARSMLLKALPHMFHYLDDPRIPRTTNALEGYFGRLKDRYRDHRGLAAHHRLNYFQWYFYLCPR